MQIFFDIILLNKFKGLELLSHIYQNEQIEEKQLVNSFF